MQRDRHLSVPNVSLADEELSRLATQLNRQRTPEPDQERARRSSLIAAQQTNLRLLHKLKLEALPSTDRQELSTKNLKLKTHFHRPHRIDTSDRVECNPDLINETEPDFRFNHAPLEKNHRKRSRSGSTFSLTGAVGSGTVLSMLPFSLQSTSIQMNENQSNDTLATSLTDEMNGANKKLSSLSTSSAQPEDVQQLASTVSNSWFTKNRSNKMLKLFILLLMLIVCVFLCIRFIVDNIRPTVVRTPLGAIHGKTVQRLGKSVHEFLGIPFAQPPTETLRFRKPRPIRSWSRPLKAYHKASDCPRYAQESLEDENDTSTAISTQSEDCLYLNIWVPGDFLGQKDRVAESGRLAVLVWIHGGAFVMGSSNNHDGGALAAFGHVIVVSIAYRLGVFGFAYSGEATTASGTDEELSVPANIGLHDQVAALRWIRQYVSCFGGDPERVTLMGESAGGMSAGFHMLSPLSRHLFSRLIMQSGSAISPNMLFGSRTGPLKFELLLQLTGCPYQNRSSPHQLYASFTRDSFRCIRKLPLSELLNAQNKIMEQWKDLGFQPMVDKRFFPEHPYDTVDYKDFAGPQREILMGTNANEGALFLSMAMPRLFPVRSELPSNLSVDLIIKHMKSLAPADSHSLLYLLTNYLQSGLSHHLDNGDGHFSSNGSIAEQPKPKALIIVKRLDRLVSELLFLCPDLSLVNSITSNLANRVYYYRFMPKSNVRRQLATWAPGALHYEEVQFVFGRPLMQPEIYRSDERTLSRLMMRYWTNFAKYGDPTPEFDIIQNEFWLPCEGEKRYYMEINLKSKRLIESFPQNNCTDYFDDFYNYVRFKYDIYFH